MDRRLRDYLPHCMQGIREMEALVAAEDVVFDRSWQAVDSLLEGQFIDTAPEPWLRRWERMLQLPGGGELESRRFQILSKVNNKLPYHINWLHNKLAVAFGDERGFTIERDLAKHELTVQVDMIHAGALAALYADLRQSIPADMLLHTVVSSAEPLAVYQAFIVQAMEEINV